MCFIHGLMDAKDINHSTKQPNSNKMQINDQITVDWHHSVKRRKTVCVIAVNENRVQGVSRAHSKDLYSKKEGRKHSLCRALTLATEANLTGREERTEVWSTMKNKGVKLF